MGRAAWRHESVRRHAARRSCLSGWWQDHYAVNTVRALVLSAGDIAVRGVVRSCRSHHRRSLAAGQGGIAYRSHPEFPPLAGFLSRRTAAPHRVIPTPAIPAIAPVGQHGRFAGSVPRWAYPGKRRLVVSDGPHPAESALVARPAFSSGAAGKLHREAINLLGCTGNDLAHLAALSGHAG